MSHAWRAKQKLLAVLGLHVSVWLAICATTTWFTWHQWGLAVAAGIPLGAIAGGTVAIMLTSPKRVARGPSTNTPFFRALAIVATVSCLPGLLGAIIRGNTPDEVTWMLAMQVWIVGVAPIIGSFGLYLLRGWLYIASRP